MKARDIIPGWPRSRTSMRVMSKQMDLELLAACIARIRQFGEYQLLRSSLRSELLQESCYHQMQQLRLNAWFEYWRCPGAVNIFVPDLAMQVSFRRVDRDFHSHFLQLMYKKGEK